MELVVGFICPCKGCKDRELACHDKCSKYQKWKVWRNEVLEREKKEHQLNDWTYYSHGYRRRRK